jgi:CheY-like chemotaxis protein
MFRIPSGADFMNRDGFQFDGTKNHCSHISKFHYSPPAADGRSDLGSKNNFGIMTLPAAYDADIIGGTENRNRSVLVVNDSKKVRKQLSTLLHKIGSDVVVSNNGAEALDLFIKKYFDIVFTALKMPGMDGLTFSLQIKAASLNAPVVLILDEHIKGIMNRIKAGRIDGVIFKPFRFGEIQKTVQYFWRNGSYEKNS